MKASGAYKRVAAISQPRPITVPEKLAPQKFLEERMVDYHMLKRENQILKEENKLLRGEVINRFRRSGMEQSEIVQLIELQRMRIDN